MILQKNMASKKVIISEIAEDVVGRYFEEYRVYRHGSDLQIRAFNYSKIRSILTYIDAFFDDIYIKNVKNTLTLKEFAPLNF
jgi:hypothetical protein